MAEAEVVANNASDGFSVQAMVRSPSSVSVKGPPLRLLSSRSVDLDKMVHCLRPDLPVAGRLRHFIPFWELIRADAWVLETVANGYSLEVISPPAFQGVRKTTAGKKSGRVLSGEVEDLVTKGAVVPIPLDQEEMGYYSTYFLVPKKDGGLRPILNLRYFNRHVQKRSFRMETLPSVLITLTKGCWLASIDLKDAYFHVAVVAHHQQYLRFHFGGQAYQYVTLPFGLTSAPRVFTKILAPLLAWLRTRGIHVCAYLDDLIIVGRSPRETRQFTSLVAETLISAGFILNLKKSELQPSQDLVYIGGRLRPDLGMVFLPEDRLSVLVRCVRTFLRQGVYKPAHHWLRLLGLMAATLTVVFQARFHMRPIQWHVKRRWNHTMGLKAPVMVSASVIQALQWWLSADNLRQGLPFQPLVPALTVGTDASKEGWGGHAVVQGVKALFGDLWSVPETRLHINVLEMRAVRLTLQHLEPHIRGRHLLVECDNTSTVAYINKQGGVLSWSLWEETKLLFSFLQGCHATLVAVHQPGVDNELADYLSRTRPDPHEWSLQPRVVQRLFAIWGRPQVDAFASHMNHHLPVWFSRSPHPEAAAVDALTQSWTGLSLFAFPPIPLILQTLTKIRSDQPEVVILVLPTWPRRVWYQLLMQLACSPPIELPLRMDLLSQVLPERGTLYHTSLKSLRLAAWLVSGQPSRVRAFQRQLCAQPSRPPGPRLEQSMMQGGQHGLAGVVNGVPIRFRPL